jgi:hypothetical protein
MAKAIKAATNAASNANQIWLVTVPVNTRMAMAAWNWSSVANKKFIAANPAVKALLLAGISRR